LTTRLAWRTVDALAFTKVFFNMNSIMNLL
jgi:hypothetical protein